MVQLPPVAKEIPGNVDPSCMVQPPCATTEIPGMQTLSHMVQPLSAATEIPENADPQTHGTATIYGHGNSKECRPSVTWYSHHIWPRKFRGMHTPVAWCSHSLQPQKFWRTQTPVAWYSHYLWPWKFQRTETLIPMVQPPPMATEIQGNADPQSHGTATTCSHRNPGEHRLQSHGAATTCSHGNSRECRPQSHGTATIYGHGNSREHRHQSHGAATTCGHGNSGECRPQSLKYELHCSECGRVSLCAELSIQKGRWPQECLPPLQSSGPRADTLGRGPCSAIVPVEGPPTLTVHLLGAEATKGSQRPSSAQTTVS